MKRKVLGPFLMAAALVLSSAMTLAAKAPTALEPESQGPIAHGVRHEILMYPYYGIFDNITYQVDGGNITLLGDVTQPYKKFDIGKRVQQVPGVTSVTNQIKVLPLSNMDDRLRWRIALAIYSEPGLSRYANQPVPPIHIIVDNGHVTLDGVVNNQMEKDLAGIRAANAGLSFGPITNNLRVEVPSSKKS